MLCDLLSAQAAVLEHNVSPQVAAQYKRASMAGISALGAIFPRCVPELGDAAAFRLAGGVVLTTAALWPHTQPSAAMLAAYEADPELAGLHPDTHRGARGAGRRAARSHAMIQVLARWTRSVSV
jgi:hypothetical protein